MFAAERRIQERAMGAYRCIVANSSAGTHFFSVDDPATIETLIAMDRFNLACHFVSPKHFDPDARFPDATLRFSIDGLGLEEG